jgi:hypothetical protein
MYASARLALRAGFIVSSPDGPRHGASCRAVATEEIMLKRIVTGLALSMMLIASCSSSESSDSKGFCDNAKSKCPNDPPLDAELCKRLIGDSRCGSVYMNFFLCVGAHQACLADGTTDESATTRECGNEQNAAVQCADADGGR